VLAPTVVVAALLADLVTGAGGQQLAAHLVKLLLGIGLLAAGWRVRPWQPFVPDLSAKLGSLEVKLAALESPTAVRVGVGLAVLPKRIAITALAGAAIGATGATLPQGLLLTSIYVLTATMLVWLTIVVRVLGGAKASASIERGRVWVTDNAAILAFVVASSFGMLFTGQSIIELVF
jgi:hypothetical protein